MSEQLYSNLAIFVLSLLVGFEVMSKIPATLQTPMMSGANAIHGVVVVGAFVVAAEANSWGFYILAFLCAFFAAVNVAGGCGAWLEADKPLVSETGAEPIVR